MKYSMYDLQLEEYVKELKNFESKEHLKKRFTDFMNRKMEEDELEKMEVSYENFIDFFEYRMVVCDENENENENNCEVIER
ncbi:hypothetical protein [Staphylococcus pettenkoferi]|uniref:hypothetical protein n=1 Tax=Staphylococcus pettenkoferi TaxID=170573 RepID=UPI00255275C4|nr:hypothetical protein [Staphylococcus pettenkoferi]MDK7284470.1 hypothetical protein [Staphylococcus pettenkoferi]